MSLDAQMASDLKSNPLAIRISTMLVAISTHFSTDLDSIFQMVAILVSDLGIQGYVAKHTLQRLVGDCLLCAGFVSYAGPFNHEYRTEMVYKDCGSVQSLVLQWRVNMKSCLLCHFLALAM